MKYQKLPVFLSGELARSELGSTNAIITEYLLMHIHDETDISVQTVADACHVGVGTVSRYVRSAGFGSFSQLRSLLSQEARPFERVNGDYGQLALFHAEAMKECLSSLNCKEIKDLARKIRDTEKVSIFGLLKGQSASFCLQADLLTLGKLTHTTVSAADQMDSILHADKRELIILFSATCSYFDYFDIRNKKEILSNRNIWMIGSGLCPEFIHHFISYISSGIPLSHPLQLMCIAEMIAQEYAKAIE